MSEVPTPAGLSVVEPPAAPLADRRSLVRLFAGFYGIVTLFSIGYALFSGHLKDLFGTAWPTAGGVLAALGMAVLLLALWHVGERVWVPVRRTTRGIQEWLGPISVRDALILAAISGVAEEVLFRGALWPHLGLWGSALLFGLVHAVPLRPFWVYPLFAAIGGLLLGLLRVADENVLPPILAHVAVNATNLVWLGHRARKEVARAEAALVVAPPPAP